MLSWVFLFVFLIIFTGVMNSFKIAQQASHKREPTFHTRKLTLKRWGTSPPNQLKKYLSPWSAKGHSREYQSNEKQRGYEIEVAAPCRKSREKLGIAGLVSSGDFDIRMTQWSSMWSFGQYTRDLHLCRNSIAAYPFSVLPFTFCLPSLFLRTQILQSSMWQLLCVLPHQVLSHTGNPRGCLSGWKSLMCTSSECDL